MFANKRFSVGVGALTILLSQTQAVKLNDCHGCGGGNNNADINLNFEVNVASLLRQATADMPESEREAILTAAGITGDEGIGEDPVVVTQTSQPAAEETGEGGSS